MDKMIIEKIKTKEEFFLIFNGLCKIAESAFNSFEDRLASLIAHQHPIEIYKEISYLMSITFVITGMRGNYEGFNNQNQGWPFFVIIDGIEYNQKYLYKMNDYFTYRLNALFAKIKDIAPEYHKHYEAIWRIF